MKRMAESKPHKTRLVTNALAAVGAGALVLKGIRIGYSIFGPTRPFQLEDIPSDSPDHADFAGRLACVSGAILYSSTHIQVLHNGVCFYPAEFAAIDSARESINLEAFIFYPGEVTKELIRRLTERARAGVAVRLIIDRLGSMKTSREYFLPLLKAGGKVVFYHPLSLRDLPYLDNRTHRKLLTVDGRIGFIGGAGWADQWIQYDGAGSLPPWRDSVFKLHGEAVRSLNATFAQNWVSSTGEVLFSTKQFPDCAEAGGNKTCMVVISTPGYGTTRARLLFQTLIETARRSIQITSPYFLPDRSAREALIRAARDRKVDVQILTVGRHTDHNMIRYLSEGRAAKLIQAGVRFYEYQPGMLHAKLMTVDHEWTVAGSTNFDYRSFTLNDELNIAICDRQVTGEVEAQFARDCKEAKQMSLEDVRPKNLSAEAARQVSWLFRREE